MGQASRRLVGRSRRAGRVVLFLDELGCFGAVFAFDADKVGARGQRRDVEAQGLAVEVADLAAGADGVVVFS